MKKFFFGVFVLVLTGSSAWAEKQPFDRYQSILDRQMFGTPPPGFDPTKMPSEVQKTALSEKQLTQEQEKLQSSISFSVINVTPEGLTAVGFTDNSDPKAPRHYYLKVGETRDGWTVKEADAVAATMTIAKGDIEVTLSIGGDSSKNADATAKAGGAQPAPAQQANRPFGLRGGLLGGGLRARREQRRQAEAKAKAEAAADAQAKEAERLAQAEADKAQREAERAEQRQQLLAIQEELKRVREAKAADKQTSESDAGTNEND